MLKDKDGKDVTVHITKDTKVLKDKKAMKLEDIKTGMRVVIAAVSQLAVGMIVKHPWAVPDLLLASLVVVSVGAGRGAPLAPALVGGALAMVVASTS